MPVSPGSLQKTILQKLKSHRSTLPITQYQLFWEMAFDRNEIIKTGRKFISEDIIIEEGSIKKSFDINFRRALKDLKNSGEIIITKKKSTALEDFLTSLPYITSRLEVFQLRVAILPTIKKYLTEKKPLIYHKDFDPFGYQLKILKKKNPSVYREIFNYWEKIEIKIVKLLSNANFERFDDWIDNLSWGRYYFRGRKSRMELKLNTETVEETDIKKMLEDLVGKVKPFDEYKIGNVKKILYTLFSAPSHRKTFLTTDFKYYLFKEREPLLRSLPGDEDWDFKGFKVPLDYQLEKRKYSPLLDDIFNRHIFRELSFIDLPK